MSNNVALTYRNIASILNNQVIRNALGETVTVNEDLSNLVEIANAVGDDTKNVIKGLIVGIHNFVLSRIIESEEFNLLRDSIEYGGGIQRIMASGLFDAQESHILNLTHGVDYHDGKFYGVLPSANVVEKVDTFKVAYSVADDNYSTMFNNASDLHSFANLVAITEENTIRLQVSELAKRVICMAIFDKAQTNGSYINLMDEFNKMQGRNTEPTEELHPSSVNDVKWSFDELRKHRTEYAYFMSMAKSIVERICAYVKNPSRKYNDGTIVTWTPSKKTEVLLLKQFETEIAYYANPIEHNPKDISVNYKTVSTWQNATSELLPDYGISASVNNDGTTVENIVGFIYDVDGMGIITRLNKITTESVGSEGFVNIFHHMANNYYVDPRLNAIVIKLF